MRSKNFLRRRDIIKSMIEDNRLPLKERAIEFLSKNPFYKHAAWAIGKDEVTLLRWRNEDADFASRCEVARASCLSRFVSRSQPDFILTHADPETFNTAKKIDITSGGKPIQSILTALKDDVQHNDSNQETVDVK